MEDVTENRGLVPGSRGGALGARGGSSLVRALRAKLPSGFPWRRVLSYTLIALVAVVVIIQLKNLDYTEYKQQLTAISPLQRVLVLAVGVVAFSAGIVYDILFARFFALPIRLRDVVRTSFVAQSFNNFVNIGGLAGIKFRETMLRRNSAETTQAFRLSMAVWGSTLLGLSALTLPSLLVISFAADGHASRLAWIVIIFAFYVPVYFALGKVTIPWLTKKLEASMASSATISSLSIRQRGIVLGASIFDWAVAGAYFVFVALTVAAGDFGGVNPWAIAAVFFIAAGVGVLSFLPGGIGSFDATALALLAAIGYPASSGLAVLVLFRLGFYLLPWLLGCVVAVVDWAGSMPSWVATAVAKFCAIYMALAGLALVVASATPTLEQRAMFFGSFLPNSAFHLSRVVTALCGVALIVLGRGLLQRSRRMYQVAVVVLPVGAIFAYYVEEMLLLLAVWGLLIACRRVFDRPARMPERRDIVINFSLATIVVLAYAAIFRATHGVDPFAVRSEISEPWANYALPTTAVFIVAVYAITAVITFSRNRRLIFEPVDDAEVERFAEFLEKHPGNEYTHLFFMRDKNVFYNQAGTVAIQYRPQGKYLLVLGDPAGQRDDFEVAIDEFVEFAIENSMRVAFYQVDAKNLGLYADQGFTFLKLGESAMVDLKNFSLAGKSNKPLRRALASAEKKGVSFEIIEPPFTAELLGELREISDEWLGSRNEMHYSLGAFDDDYVQRAPVAVLRNSDAEIIAFATIMPVAGTATISIDLMRHSPSKSEGEEMLLVILNTMQWAREQGYAEFNLGMAPLANVGTKRYSPNKEKLVSAVYRYGNRVYSFTGLRQFKQKFHPAWRSSYLIYQGSTDLPETLLGLVEVVRGKRD